MREDNCIPPTTACSAAEVAMKESDAENREAAMFDICFIALHSVWARDALFGLLKSIV